MSVHAAAASGTVSLREAWELRNAAAVTLLKTEQQLRRLLEAANVDGIVGLLEAFSPARSPGPDWTRTFDALVERMWAWCDAPTLAAVEAEFRRRGPAWVAVANALAPERGQELRAQLGRVLTDHV
jgi:predicted lipoprotein